MPTYATERDVKRILQTVGFDTKSRPTKEEINDSIEAAEDEIDHQTQHAWREKQVTDEYYDIPSVRNPEGWGFSNGTGLEINLRHRAIKTANPTTATPGDKLEIWNGGSYDNWLTTKTEGRANDFWFDQTQGQLYLRYFIVYFRIKAIRLTYRYGDETVPKDIREATAIIAAIELLENDDRSANLNETTDPTRLDYDQRISKLTKRANKIIKNHTELIVV